ncbi:hypothetical protein AB205_0095070 [Aquarana catesbeiana]|uniref:Uncharacterized protein n=1 Tax=Aquarana catesbeiana TaxID=8400 RepID=A0A2G9RX06_AQUCT|nr:hypothetical protein AB205_0095070 [Aquarana catesbeiana]
MQGKFEPTSVRKNPRILLPECLINVRPCVRGIRRDPGKSQFFTIAFQVNTNSFFGFKLWISLIQLVYASGNQPQMVKFWPSEMKSPLLKEHVKWLFDSAVLF